MFHVWDVFIEVFCSTVVEYGNDILSVDCMSDFEEVCVIIIIILFVEVEILKYLVSQRVCHRDLFRLEVRLKTGGILLHHVLLCIFCCMKLFFFIHVYLCNSYDESKLSSLKTTVYVCVEHNGES